MIFNVPGHIGMIRNGMKTQTRGVYRGCYKEGEDYEVQRTRGMEAEPDIRILMDAIWEENFCTVRRISTMDALAEGGYYPIVFEELFRAVNPKWDQLTRWAFKFHVIDVQK